MKKNLLKIIYIVLISLTSTIAKSQITWNMGMNIATSSSGNEHPRIVTVGSGNPVVLWGHANRAMFSRWNGSSFTLPMMLHPATMMVAQASWMGPDISSHGDTVYVVFKQFPEADTSSHIYIVRSFDGGINFSSPVQVDNIGDSISRFPTVTTDDTGNPIVSFMKFNPSFGDARWVVTQSADYGITFTTDKKASGWSAAGATVCDCCPGALVCNSNNLVMLYRDNNSNIRDTWAGVSSDTGSSFTTGIAMDQNNWMLMSCPSSGPDGVIINDSLYSVFMNGASGMSKVYYSTASLTSGGVQPLQLLTGSISGLTQQNYPRISISGSAIAVVWKQVVNGADQLPILFSNDIGLGLPSVYDTVDLNSITNADVALFNGTIYVVWEDDVSGTVKFRSGNYTPVSTLVLNMDHKLTLAIYPNPATSDELLVYLNNDDQNVEFSVSNLLAEALLSGHTLVENNKLKIDVKSLPAGIYFLKIHSGHLAMISKFIKQ